MVAAGRVGHFAPTGARGNGAIGRGRRLAHPRRRVELLTCRGAHTARALCAIQRALVVSSASCMSNYFQNLAFYKTRKKTNFQNEL